MIYYINPINFYSSPNPLSVKVGTKPRILLPTTFVAFLVGNLDFSLFENFDDVVAVKLSEMKTIYPAEDLLRRPSRDVKQERDTF